MSTKTMSAWEARRNFGKLLNEVTRNRQPVIVESHGEPVAAVVPLHILESYRRAGDRLEEIASAAAARANLTEEEAMEIAIREIAAYHAEKREASEALRHAGGG